MKECICEKIVRCGLCLKTVSSNRKHVCGEIYCEICRSHVAGDHFCFMPIDRGSPKMDNILFIFYDLETRQEKKMSDGSLLHEPNLCVFRQCCNDCINKNYNMCQKCGVKLQVLRCSIPISPFLHHILTLRKKFKHIVVIAHNGGGFDHQFILIYIGPVV